MHFTFTSIFGLFQDWLEAIEDHSAYSTHYCSQDQLSDDEEEDAISAVDLKESLEVMEKPNLTFIANSVTKNFFKCEILKLRNLTVEVIMLFVQ